MPSVPSLEEALAILGSLHSIEADVNAQRLDQRYFTVILTLDRESLRAKGATSFANEEPTPIWLITAIIGFLQELREGKRREQQWSQTQPQGATLNDCVAFITGQILREKKDVAGTYTRKLYERTLNYLVELHERRQAGGFRNPHQERQDADSAKWRFEDSPAAEELRRQQANQRQKQNSTNQYSYQNAWFEEFFSDRNRSRFEEGFTFSYGANTSNQYAPPPPPPPPPGPFSGGRWFEVLGVPASANADEIKKAARKLTSKYHPDRYKGVDAAARMSAINVARDEGLAGLG